MNKKKVGDHEREKQEHKGKEAFKERNSKKIENGEKLTEINART